MITQALITPNELIAHLPVTTATRVTVARAHQEIKAILDRQDDRLLMVIGPCSIHDEAAALEYAQRLATHIPRFNQTLCIIMRAYLQKPRTVLGWKGFIHDPFLNESFDVDTGLHRARRLLLAINQCQVPAASEFLDLIIPQYIADLVAWSAIGARTTESQIHRQLASGLTTPVGFKNNQSGDIQVAVNAVYAAKYPQHFLSIDGDGKAALISTTGNPWCHIVLRGGHNGPNYTADAIQCAVQQLQAKQLAPNIMVDCAHDNSSKDHLQQMPVAANIAAQIAAGNSAIVGMMLESHLVGGKQKLAVNKPLIYGQSITDACLGWNDSLQILEMLDQAVLARRARLAHLNA